MHFTIARFDCILDHDVDSDVDTDVSVDTNTSIDWVEVPAAIGQAVGHRRTRKYRWKFVNGRRDYIVNS